MRSNGRSATPGAWGVSRRSSSLTVDFHIYLENVNLVAPDKNDVTYACEFEKQCRLLLDLFKLQIVFTGMLFD